MKVILRKRFDESTHSDSNCEVVKEYEIVSQSLIISSPTKSKKSDSELKKFCLGLPEWCPCCMKSDSDKKKLENNSEGSGSKSLSLKLKRPLCSNDRLKNVVKDFHLT